MECNAFKKIFRYIVPLMLAFALIFSRLIGKFVREGLSVCAASVIPSVFPFSVFASAFLAAMPASGLPLFAATFEKIFHVSRNGADAFLVGVLCGFPLGAVSTMSLYRRRLINKDEAERLLAFSSCPSPAFLTVAVGASIRNNFGEGILLCIFSVLSAVCVGVVLGIGKTASACDATAFADTFRLIPAIRNAGENTLRVCAYVCFFSVVCGFLSLLPPALSAVLLPLTEMTCACSALSAFAEPLSFVLTAFSVSFSGGCVIAQTVSILSDSDLSARTFICGKVLQGLFSALAATLFSFFR